MRAFTVAAFVLLSCRRRHRGRPGDAPAPVQAEEPEDEPRGAAATAHPGARASLRHLLLLSVLAGRGQTDFGYGPPEEATAGRYPIAGFYRAGASRPLLEFWTTGYCAAATACGAARRRGRGLIGARRPRALGLNGDLCLFAPTFLAPVGPLTGVFFER